MFISLLLLFFLTIGGLSLTYLFAEDEPLMWRLCAGNIIGLVVFGLICFLTACFFGFTTPTILLSLAITLLPLILLSREPWRGKFLANWRTAKGKTEGTDLNTYLRFGYYVFFFVVFWLFFERTMFETPIGISTGASQNLGDLPFHLGAIFGFTDGQNFPPQNPSFADAKFTYPFMADFLTASFVALGAQVRGAMMAQNIFLAFSLLVILERFTFKLTNNRLAGKIAPALLFFSGGLGFLWFFNDFFQQTKGISEFLLNLPKDYTIGDKFRWGNSLTTLFVTQRSLLLGLPLTLIVLQKIWEIFNVEKGKSENVEKEDSSLETNFSPFPLFPFSPFLVGLLAGTLPLIHAHSLVVLFIVSAFLFFFSAERWREWIAFGVGVAIVAVPELLWVMSGSATDTSAFISWHFGWDKRDANFLWFWLINTGIFIPLLLFGLYLIALPQSRKDPEKVEKKKTKAERKTDELDSEQSQIPNPKSQILFYVPFVFLFIISNSAKLAPWEWDNIKVLIYWFVASIPFVALVLAWIWNKNIVFKFIAAACLIVLTLAGALDVWRVVTKQIDYGVFSTDAVKIAEQIKQKTAPNALFLNAPTYNTAIALSGRRSLMRYPGHLSSHGINYAEREADLKQIYTGGGTAEPALKKYNINYILIGPEVENYLKEVKLTINPTFFQKFPVAAEAGRYKVYKVN
jgi:MFS family permease